MPPTNRFLNVGLTALGLLGVPVLTVAVAASPTLQESPSTPPTVPVLTTPAPVAGLSKVLLLYNGEQISGEITEDDKAYVLHRNGGEIRIAKDRVEEAFADVRELYQYKLEQIPAKDPDERLKLARWCLAQKLEAEAKLNLEAVLKISPGAREAKAMLTSIKNAEIRRSEALAKRRDVDSEVMQSNAEMTIDSRGSRRPSVDGFGSRSDRPSELDDAVIRKAQKELGVTGLPVIFDLPTALAVKRADQFNKNVQPVLQASCVRCHNETSDRTFQMIEIKGRKDATIEVCRANLDAVLQFVNRDQPAKSEILSIVLLPHGGGRTPRPVFRGSNDPKYQILSAWVTSLKQAPAPRATGGAASATDHIVPQSDAAMQRVALKDSDFGIDRAGGIETAATNPPLVSNDRREISVDAREYPPMKYVPGKGFKREKAPPGPDKFPKPLSVGGTLPKSKATPYDPDADEDGPVDPDDVDDAPNADRPVGKTAKGEATKASEAIDLDPKEVDPSKFDPLALARAQAKRMENQAVSGTTKAKPKTKPIKRLDPNLLQQTLNNRVAPAPR